jgi:hypothetical protein
MTQRFPLVLNGSQIQELQPGDSFPADLGVVSATPDTIPARDGSADIFANVFRGVATSARYADLAEKYLADADYTPGTVVVFGGNAEITVTEKFADTRVAGVISTNPAYIMNEASPGPAVALRGKVPVKIVGKVNKGDLLVTSNVPGFAQVALANFSPNAVFAKSLESKDSEEAGTVMAVVV